VNCSKKSPIFKYLSILLICSSFILHSCATKKDTEFIEIETNQVEKSLGIDDKKFNKFIVKVNPDEAQNNNAKVEETTQEDSLKETKANEPSKTIQKDKNLKNKKTIEKKTNEQKPVEDNSKEVDSDQLEVGKLKQDNSLEPYPEEFHQYDQISKKIWPKSQAIIGMGEKFVFQLSYIGLTAGHIQIETKKQVKIGDQDAFHFSAKLRSARYYSYIYSLDDSLDSYVSQKKFLPIKYVLAQRESSQVVDDLQLFDVDELKTYHWYKRVKQGKLKEVELTKHIPSYFQDSFSALHFVRSLPLKEGDVYEFPIVTRGKIWKLKLKVEETEKIEIMDEEVSAIRINAETRFPGVLEKKGDILFWFSADKKKKLLKFEAQVKIGTVSGELIEYVAGEPL
jgi:hypothetical protein